MIPPEFIPRTSLGPGFSRVLRRHRASAASAALARRVQGLPGPGFSLLDLPQLEALEEALDLSPGDRLADLGCGLGQVARLLAREAPVLGLDLAVGALAAAHGLGDRAPYAAADLAALPLGSGCLDALVAVDSLYFLPDPSLDRAVAEAARVLVPGGRLAALASELLPEPGERPPERTRLGRALDRAGFEWMAKDLTNLEHAFWQRRAEELPGLEAAFAGEGNRDLWQALAEETARGLQWSRQRRVRRYLFRAVRSMPGQVSASS